MVEDIIDTRIDLWRPVNGIDYEYPQDAANIRTISREYQSPTGEYTLVNIDFNDSPFTVAVVAHGQRSGVNIWDTLKEKTSLLSLHTLKGMKHFNPAFIDASSICSRPHYMKGKSRTVTEFKLLPKKISGEIQDASAIAVYERKGLVLEAIKNPSITRMPKINLVVPYHDGTYWTHNVLVDIGSILSIGPETTHRDEIHKVTWRTAPVEIGWEDKPLTILTYRDKPPHPLSTRPEPCIYTLPPELAKLMLPNRPFNFSSIPTRQSALA
ncbi:MAG: hypothetical protein WC521_06280 [Bdellovibrionales bacterium]